MSLEFSGLEGNKTNFGRSQIYWISIENQIAIEIIKNFLIHDVITKKFKYDKRSVT